MFILAIDNGIAALTLDRPARRNAIPADGWDRLTAQLDAIPDGARLLTLAGAGGAFCAGADLGDFPMAPDAAAAFRQAMRRAFERLAARAIPTVALIDGACYGAGVALAMACDLRVAGPGAQFAITPAKIGISYPHEDIHRLVGLVGSGQASRLLLTGLAIDAAEAHRIGLVDLRAQGEERAALLAAIMANGAEALAELKRGIALAAAGIAQDDMQDARFDALLGGAELVRRLEARRRT